MSIQQEQIPHHKTLQTVLEKQKQRELQIFSQDKLPYLTNKPTRYFEPDEKVIYGNMVQSIVETPLFDNLAYLLKCTKKETNYGNPYYTDCYRVVPWHKIYKLNENQSKFIDRSNFINQSNFTTNVPVKISYSQRSISSLLFEYYNGLNMNPEYQRNYCWESSDKEKLIESIFLNADIGKFTLYINSFNEYLATNYQTEIIDGKQRLNTLIEFYEDRFQYKGYYFSELSNQDKQHFLNYNISYGSISNATRKEIYQTFILLNRTGKQISDEEIQNVESLLKEL